MSELMLPAWLKGWVCYWLGWRSFWTMWEIKEISGSWRTSIVLHPLLSRWGEWSRSLIIEKCSCFQCWEKSFCVKKVLWTKHTEWRSKSQFLNAMPTCVGIAPVILLIRLLTPQRRDQLQPDYSSPALMVSGRGQEHSSWSFISNKARQIKQKEFSSIGGREYHSQSLLGAWFSPSSAQEISTGSSATPNAHRCSKKKISYPCLSRAGGKGIILVSLYGGTRVTWLQKQPSLAELGLEATAPGSCFKSISRSAAPQPEPQPEPQPWAFVNRPKLRTGHHILPPLLISSLAILQISIKPVPFTHGWYVLPTARYGKFQIALLNHLLYIYLPAT